MSLDQLYRMHQHEQTARKIIEFDPVTGDPTKVEDKAVRCLFPYEIQEIFHLPSLKETWRIPENPNLQERHNMNLRQQFREKGMIPLGGDLSSTDVERVHTFDDRVKSEIEKNTLDFTCQISTKRRVSDSIPENDAKNRSDLF